MIKPLTLASGKQSLAGWSDLCKPPRQSLREEAKLVFPQNTGCLSGSPLIPLDAQTCALLLSPQNISPEPPALILKSGCTLSSEHS